MPKIICKGSQNKGFGRDAVSTGMQIMQIGGKKMPRYIDADEVFKQAVKFRETYDGFCALQKTINLLKTAPTADVAEVRHGKWLVVDDDLWAGGGRYECSACKFGFSFGGFFEMNTLPYCPHCGAKMEVPDEEPT